MQNALEQFHFEIALAARARSAAARPRGVGEIHFRRKASSGAFQMQNAFEGARMKGKSGLGARGDKKISNSADALFRQTENAETHNADKKQNLFVRRQYMLSYELSEKLREQCFRERRKEVDIVREALTE